MYLKGRKHARLLECGDAEISQVTSLHTVTPTLGSVYFDCRKRRATTHEQLFACARGADTLTLKARHPSRRLIITLVAWPRSASNRATLHNIPIYLT